MSVTSGFFNSLNHDRLYDATQMSQLFDGLIRDGIYESIGTCFTVNDNGGLYVTVGVGRAWFNHTWIYNDAILPLALNGDYAPEVLTNRYDAIVIDVDSSPDVRADSIIVVKGTPSSEIDFRDYVNGTVPSSITLINEENHHQYPIAIIERPAGQTSIKGSEIHNVVGTEHCPFVTGILEILDATTFFKQWGDDLDEFVAKEEGDFSKWSDKQKQEFLAWVALSKTDFDQWMSDEKADFDAWYANLRLQLDGDVATNLQGQISDLQRDKLDKSVYETEIGDTDISQLGNTITEAIMNSGGSRLQITVNKEDGVTFDNVVVTATQGDYTLSANMDTIDTIEFSGFRELTPINVVVNYEVDMEPLSASGSVNVDVYKKYSLTFNIKGTGGGGTGDLTADALIAASRWTGTKYSTIEEILEDEKCVRQIMTVHDSQDIIIDAVTKDVNELDQFTSSRNAMKWIGHRDRICDKLMAIEGATEKLLNAKGIVKEIGPIIPPITNDNGVLTLTDLSGSNKYANGTFEYSKNDYSGSGTYVLHNSGYAYANINEFFDNNNSTGGLLANDIIISVKLPKPMNVHSAKIVCGVNNGSYPLQYIKIYTSKDGGITQDLKETKNVSSSEGSKTTTYDISFTKVEESVNWVGVCFKSGSLPNPYDIQFYGEVEVETDLWPYILKDKVPVMTSNTAPEGEAKAYSELSGYEAWKAFDETEDGNSSWISNNATDNIGWIQYKFVNPICVKRFYASRKDDSPVKNKSVKISYSNDGTNWKDAYTHGAYDNIILDEIIDNNVYALYWRFTVEYDRPSGNVTRINLFKLQFYGRSLNVSVPVMTGDTTPLGEAFSDELYYSTNKAFDVFTESGNSIFLKVNSNGSFGYDFEKRVCVKTVAIKNVSPSGGPRTKSFNVQGYNIKEQKWETIYSGTLPNETSTPYNYYNFDNNKYYNKHRLLVLDTYNSVIGITKLNFYGVSYSEEEFGDEGIEMLYDNGVDIAGQGFSIVKENYFTETDDYILADDPSSATGSYGFYCCNKPILFDGSIDKVILEFKDRTGSRPPQGLYINDKLDTSYNAKAKSYIDIMTNKDQSTLQTSGVIALNALSISGSCYACMSTDSSDNGSTKYTKLYLLKKGA